MNKNTVATFDLRSIVGIAMAALIIVIFFVIRSGFWGLVVGGILVATLIYWLDIRGGIFCTKKDQFPEAVKRFYDLFGDREGFVFTARVPGPAQEVKVKLRKDVLSVRGGKRFFSKCAST